MPTWFSHSRRVQPETRGNFNHNLSQAPPPIATIPLLTPRRTMPGVSAEYRSRLRQREAASRDKRTSSSRQRRPDSSSSSSRTQMPLSGQTSGDQDVPDNKIDELKSDISEMYDFYGYDAILYYVLSTTERCYEIWIRATHCIDMYIIVKQFKKDESCVILRSVAFGLGKEDSVLAGCNSS